MIKIFRNIRRKLFQENRFIHYLLYALGEIILVVIGILIALKVNTWNQQRLENRAKETYSKSLLVDLKTDSIQLQSDIQQLKVTLHTLAGQYQRLSSKNATLDTLAKIVNKEFDPAFVRPRELSSNTYLTLISTGDISFFNSAETQTIQQYYGRKEEIAEIQYEQIRLYQSMFSQFMAQIPKYDIYEKGPLRDELWKLVDKPRAMIVATGTFDAKEFNTGRFLDLNEGLLDLNESLKKEISKSLK